MTSLRNKTLVLTGASRGIGKALAVELSKAGVSLALGARTEEKLLATRDLCRAHGTKAEALPGDVSSSNVAQELVQTAHEMGEFYGFIHAAGILAPGPSIWELNKSQFRDVMDASVTASHQLIRHATPLLLDNGGGLAVFSDQALPNAPNPGSAHTVQPRRQKNIWPANWQPKPRPSPLSYGDPVSSRPACRWMPAIQRVEVPSNSRLSSSPGKRMGCC